MGADVLDLIKENEWTTAPELLLRTDINRSSLSTSLKKLFNQKLVLRRWVNGHNKYEYKLNVVDDESN